MEKALVVVESPAKAKTIKKYLGPGYEVKASVGHIKDLPAKELGVRVNEGFVPEYQIIDGKEKIVSELCSAARKVDRVFLATDPDREGEAIAWHLREALNVPAEKVFRVLFNELTERTIKEAVSHPTRLDPKKLQCSTDTEDSGQAGRVLPQPVTLEKGSGTV